MPVQPEGDNFAMQDAGGSRFERLSGLVGSCVLCPGMACRPVLSDANGPAAARVMLVGEAPGRLGAGRTGIPFNGDATARRLDRFLAEAGLVREEVFLTNAVLCLPLDASGRNRPPSRREQANCLAWLRETVMTVDPGVVVAMGRVALVATDRLDHHGLGLSAVAEAPRTWFGRRLAVMYHPGARTQVHRSTALQQEDWRRFSAWLAGQRR